MAQDPNAVMFSFFNEIGILEQLARTQFERSLPDDLRMSHFSVLNHFARLGGERSPLELATAFQVTKGAMTNTLKRLEARGLIEIKPDPRDGRAKLVRMNAKGQRVRDEAIKAAMPLFNRLGEKFAPEDFEQALPFLQELRQFLDQDRN